jgi:DNA invertase Pin-like site-specific DNA recombinase
MSRPPTPPDRATVAAYVRVSSASQSHDMQVQAIERAARARGDAFPVAWYRETMTGGKMKRPALERLRADVRAGRVSRLYVYRLDRLSRTGIRDTLDLVNELERHYCQLVSIADGFDVGGPARDIVLAVLAWAAQVERDAIGERIRAARAKVEAKGGAWGRPSRMTPAQCSRASELAAMGKSVRQISEALRVPRSTVGRVVLLERSARRPEKVVKKRGGGTPKKPGVAKGKRGASR